MGFYCSNNTKVVRNLFSTAERVQLEKFERALKRFNATRQKTFNVLKRIGQLQIIVLTFARNQRASLRSRTNRNTNVSRSPRRPGILTRNGDRYFNPPRPINSFHVWRTILELAKPTCLGGNEDSLEIIFQSLKSTYDRTPMIRRN